MDNFFNRLAPRPSDYGGLPGKITREDDAGNVYDETGRKIYNKFDPVDQPDSWLDTAVSTATAPAKLATGLVGSLSPYGQDGWQVPPIISEPAAAFARSGESTGFGPDGQFYLPNVQNPQVSQDTLTQLMTVYGGNALNPLARVPKGAVASGMPVRAASKYGDEIFTGRNHGEAYQQAVDKFGESAVDDMLAKNGSLDGFIDETGDFIDRLTANERAGGRGLNAYELLPEQQFPSDFMGVLSDNRPSLMGSALASMQGNPFRMSQAQIQAELGARPGDLLVPSASSPDGFALRDYPVPERNDLGTEPLSGYDRALLEREWRNKIRQTGELYSDNKPSLLGSALASGQNEEDLLALLGYR